ncbi:MAG: hypothetical protein CFK52_15150, partial [Chloracidobacterium sp. CP2_5A]
LARLDNAFFDNLALVAESDAQQEAIRRWRAWRQRDAANAIVKRAAPFFRSGDSTADVIAVVHASALSPAIMHALNGALAEYESKIAPLVKKRLEAAEELHRRSSWQR